MLDSGDAVADGALLPGDVGGAGVIDELTVSLPAVLPVGSGVLVDPLVLVAATALV